MRHAHSQMGGMHKPPAVHIAPGPSRIACAGIVVVAVGTFAVTLTLPIIPLAKVGCFIALAAWAGMRIWAVALRRGPRTVREIKLEGDRSLVVVHASGATSTGYLREASHVGADLTTLACQRTTMVAIDPDLARHVAGGRFPAPPTIDASQSKRRGCETSREPCLSVDEHAAVGLALARDQMHVERHQRFGRRQA